eukprot:3239198-Pyramimonas_sp.AAC.1
MRRRRRRRRRMRSWGCWQLCQAMARRSRRINFWCCHHRQPSLEEKNEKKEKQEKPTVPRAAPAFPKLEEEKQDDVVLKIGEEQEGNFRALEGEGLMDFLLESVPKEELQ